MFTVTEEDTGFDSSVLIFVDIISSRSTTIEQQMIDLNFTVSSTAISMCPQTICLHVYIIN